MGPVDAYVVLVAEHRDRKSDRLERFGIGTLSHFGLGVLYAPVSTGAEDSAKVGV